MAKRARSSPVPRLTVNRRFEPRRGGEAAVASSYEVVVPLVRRRRCRGDSPGEMTGVDLSPYRQVAATATALRGGA